jgi:hypothetical protein
VQVQVPEQVLVRQQLEQERQQLEQEPQQLEPV